MESNESDKYATKKAKMQSERGKLVSISGKEGTGKSTLCTFMKTQGYTSYSFANFFENAHSFINLLMTLC